MIGTYPLALACLANREGQAFAAMLYYSFRVQGVFVMSGFATWGVIRIAQNKNIEIHMMSTLIGAIVQLWYKSMSTLY